MIGHCQCIQFKYVNLVSTKTLSLSWGISISRGRFTCYNKHVWSWHAICFWVGTCIRKEDQWMKPGNGVLNAAIKFQRFILACQWVLSRLTMKDSIYKSFFFTRLWTIFAHRRRLDLMYRWDVRHMRVTTHRRKSIHSYPTPKTHRDLSGLFALYSLRPTSWSPECSSILSEKFRQFAQDHMITELQGFWSSTWSSEFGRKAELWFFSEAIGEG